MTKGNNNYKVITQIGPYFNTLNGIGDLSNPLSFCLVDTNTSRFLHGSSSELFTPYSKNSQIYMAEYASGNYNENDLWNQYAQFYYDNCVSLQAIYTNLGAINSNMFEQSFHNIITNFKNGECNVGKYLLRNVLERRLFIYNATPEVIPYFPNIPNINLIRDYGNSEEGLVNCAPIIKHNLDNDQFIYRLISDSFEINKDGTMGAVKYPPGKYSLVGTIVTNINLAVCYDVLALYLHIVNNMPSSNDKNPLFTAFVRKLGINTNMYSYPRLLCNPEYNCVGDEFCNNIRQMNICDVKPRKDFKKDVCEVLFESPGEEGENCCQSMYDTPWFYDKKVYSKSPEDFDKFNILPETQGSCSNNLVCSYATSPGTEFEPIGNRTGICMKPEINKKKI